MKRLNDLQILQPLSESFGLLTGLSMEWVLSFFCDRPDFEQSHSKIVSLDEMFE